MDHSKSKSVTEAHPVESEPTRTRVMLLGSGELGRELVVALQRLGAEVIAVDRYTDAPLHGVADRSVVINLTDAGELASTIRWLRPEFVVTATDAVAIDAVAAATDGGGAEVVPSVRTSRLTADAEGLRLLVADELGVPTPPFWFAGSLSELRAVAAHAGFPMTVRPVAAPPGAGRSVMVRTDDVESAWRRAVSATGGGSDVRVLAETPVEVDHHITLLTLHGDGRGGPVLNFCAPIGYHVLEDRAGPSVLETWQPQRMSSVALDAAKSIAARVVRALGGRGLFGVDLMIRGDEVYFTGVSARPYDIALLTLRTQRLSAFELQARAILGLPADTVMISPGAARLVYLGQRDVPVTAARPDAVAALAGALDVAESDAVVFSRHDGYPGRRLGVALATGSDVATARGRAERVSVPLRRLWS